MQTTTQPLIPVLDSTHHQQWQFSRFSYMEQPRPNHGFLLVLSGEMDYIGRRETLHLQPMDLVYLPQGSQYEARFHPGTDDLLINFHFVQGDTGPLPAQPCLVLRDNMHTLQPLMEQTVTLFQDEAQYFEAMSLFFRFCHQLSAQLQNEDSDLALIQRAKSLLAQPDCPPLDEVAQRLLISPSGLRKKFRDAVGVSPAHYRMRQRVENAKQLLLSTDLSMRAIAERCGFCDEAYFHKVFCKVAGVTPTAYRSLRQMHD